VTVGKMNFGKRHKQFKVFQKSSDGRFCLSLVLLYTYRCTILFALFYPIQLGNMFYPTYNYFCLHVNFSYCIMDYILMTSFCLNESVL